VKVSELHECQWIIGLHKRQTQNLVRLQRSIIVVNCWHKLQRKVCKTDTVSWQATETFLALLLKYTVYSSCVAYCSVHLYACGFASAVDSVSFYCVYRIHAKSSISMYHQLSAAPMKWWFSAYRIVKIYLVKR